MSKHLFLLVCFFLLLTGCTRRGEQAEYEETVNGETVNGETVNEETEHELYGEAQAVLQQYTPPVTEVPAVDSAAFVSERVIIGGGDRWALGGTLTIPAGASAYAPVPAVLVVHGSGASNRDGYFSGTRPYYELANYLSAHGIAVLRYDKRTYVHGAAFARLPAYRITVWEETIEDAILAADILRADPRIDSAGIYMLGHSLGGVLAPSIHAHGGDFAGLILWAGTPRCVLEVMIEQLEAGFYPGREFVENAAGIMLPLIEANDTEAVLQEWTGISDAFNMAGEEIFDVLNKTDEEIIDSILLWINTQQAAATEWPAFIEHKTELLHALPYMPPEEAQVTDAGFGNVFVYY